MPAMLRMSTVLCLLLASQALGPAAQTPASVTYEAFAVRFGILPAFPVAGLVAGADRARRVDIPVISDGIVNIK